MSIVLRKSFIEEVIDTECVMSLINTKYLIITLSKVEISKMSTSINVRDIKNALHELNVYVVLNLYLNEVFSEKKCRDHIRRKFHLINELKCKILMKLNIITSKKMIINLSDKSLIISTCENLIVSIRINSKSNSRIRRIVHSTSRNDSVRFDFCHLRIKPTLIWFSTESISIRFDSIRFFIDSQSLTIWSQKSRLLIINNFAT
jgi:hypothetical protein